MQGLPEQEDIEGRHLSDCFSTHERAIAAMSDEATIIFKMFFPKAMVPPGFIGSVGELYTSFSVDNPYRTLSTLWVNNIMFGKLPHGLEKKYTERR
jgi:hypothetical protein